MSTLSAKAAAAATADDIKAKLDSLMNQRNGSINASSVSQPAPPTRDDTEATKLAQKAGSDAARNTSTKPETQPVKAEDADLERCVICDQTNVDKTWIQCDNIKCGAWLHIECDNMTDEMLTMFEDRSRYYCPSCRKIKRVQHPAKRWKENARKREAMVLKRKAAQRERPGSGNGPISIPRSQRKRAPGTQLTRPDAPTLRVATRSSSSLEPYAAPAWLDDVGHNEDGTLSLLLPPIPNARQSLEPVFDEVMDRYTTANHTQVFVSFKGAITRHSKQNMREAQDRIDDLYKQYYQHMLDLREGLTEQLHTLSSDVLRQALDAQVESCGATLVATYPDKKAPDAEDVLRPIVDKLTVQPGMEDFVGPRD